MVSFEVKMLKNTFKGSNMKFKPFKFVFNKYRELLFDRVIYCYKHFVLTFQTIRHAFDIHLKLSGRGGGSGGEHRIDPMGGSLSISQDGDSGSGRFKRYHVICVCLIS